MPDVILMADDKQKNLDAVKETFNTLDVPVRAWRYTAEDEIVEGFQPEKADAEWKSIETALRKIQQVLGFLYVRFNKNAFALNIAGATNALTLPGPN